MYVQELYIVCFSLAFIFHNDESAVPNHFFSYPRSSIYKICNELVNFKMEDVDM